MALLLANVEFYTAADAAGRDRAMQLYDHVISIDQHEPMGRYMRGRARNALGNGKGAVEDVIGRQSRFRTYYRLSVSLAAWGLIKGSPLCPASSTYKPRANYTCGGPLHAHCSESGARSSTKYCLASGEDDARSTRLRTGGFRRSRIWGDLLAAVASYETAAERLAAGSGYAGLDELMKYCKECRLKTFRIALYKKQIGAFIKTSAAARKQPPRMSARRS